MKKLICLVTVFLMMLSLCACNGTAKKPDIEPKFFVGTWTCEQSEKSGLITPKTTLVINADNTGTLVFGTEAYSIKWTPNPDRPEILFFTSVTQIGGNEIKYDPGRSNQVKEGAPLLRVVFTVTDGVANLALEDVNLHDNMKIGALLTKDDTNPKPVIPTYVRDIAVLYTNDIHTYIDKPLSYDVLAGIKAELEKEYDTVLLVDAGDHIQGTAYGSMDKGETIIKLMNEVGYDLATLGNHEFDYGMEGRIQVTDEWANFPYVSCNFYEESNNVRGENVLPSYKIFTDSSTNNKVAFVGVTTPETFTKSTPAYFQDENGNYIYGISRGDDGADLYADVQAAVDAAKAEGATKVVILGHLGDDPSSSPWTSAETIANVSGIDAFIDGHSHSTVKGEMVADKDGKEVLLTQTGEYFDKIGFMVIRANGTIETDHISFNEITQEVLGEDGKPMKDEDGKTVTEVIGYKLASTLYKGAEWPVDEAVKAIKDAWIAEIDTQLGQKIGESTVALGNYDAEGNRLVRSQETNTGDFCADALYWLFDSMGLDVDVAIMNGGGIRNKSDISGLMTYKTAKEIHTFGNVACLQTITGQQLLDALEWGARDAGSDKECGGFLQVSGITYKINNEWASSVQADDKGVWIGAPTGGYRVYDVMVYNKETGIYEPLKLDANYNLAGYNYTLRDLGDGFNMFSGAVNVQDYVMEDYMVLANYIKAFEGGVVDATNSPLLAKYTGMLLDYSTLNGSGRIVFEVPATENAETTESTTPAN